MLDGRLEDGEGAVGLLALEDEGRQDARSARGDMEFGILGPLEVCSLATSLGVGVPKPRALVAALLVDANELVSRERLAVVVGDQ